MIPRCRNSISELQSALVSCEKADDFYGQGEVLRQLGHFAKGRGHFKESCEFYMKAHICFRNVKDHFAEAGLLIDLGQALESLDDHDAASSAYRDANRALKWAVEQENEKTTLMTASKEDKARPHRFAEKMLYLFLPKGQREHIPGDLEEEFKEVILPKFGRSYAQFWYWSQVLRSIVASNKWAARFIAYGGGVAGFYQVAKGLFQDWGWIEGDESEIKEKEVKRNL